MKSKALVALLLSFSIVLPALGQTRPSAPAQQQQPTDDNDDVVKITTNLVQVDAVVTKDGKPVPNLTAGDLEIYEDGRKQAITSFAYISNITNSTSQPGQPRNEAKNNVDVVPYVPVKPNEARRIMAFVVDDLGLSAESTFSGAEAPIQTANQPDPNRLFVTGGIQLSKDLEAGSYYLQVVIIDKNAKDKKAVPVVQWIDFEIVKSAV